MRIVPKLRLREPPRLLYLTLIVGFGPLVPGLYARHWPSILNGIFLWACFWFGDFLIGAVAINATIAALTAWDKFQSNRMSRGQSASTEVNPVASSQQPSRIW